MKISLSMTGLGKYHDQFVLLTVLIEYHYLTTTDKTPHLVNFKYSEFIRVISTTCVHLFITEMCMMLLHQNFCFKSVMN